MCTHASHKNTHAHTSKKYKPTIYIAFKMDYCLSATDGRTSAIKTTFYHLAVEAAQTLCIWNEFTPIIRVRATYLVHTEGTAMYWLTTVIHLYSVFLHQCVQWQSLLFIVKNNNLWINTSSKENWNLREFLTKTKHNLEMSIDIWITIGKVTWITYTADIILPNDGDSTHLWNVSKLSLDYMAQHPWRQSYSFPLSDPHIKVLETKM